jgi:hypothetical protein
MFKYVADVMVQEAGIQPLLHSLVIGTIVEEDVIKGVIIHNKSGRQAIADYQVLNRPFCPKNLGAHPFINREIFSRIKDYKLDGVIGQTFLCCETWSGELYILNKELKEAGVPMLRIEREYASDSSGQLQTRIQAFIEMLSGGAL